MRASGSRRTAGTNGESIAACARCLEDALFDIEVPVATLLERSEGAASTVVDEDFDPEAMDHDTFTGDVIELDGLVLEHILLEALI